MPHVPAGTDSRTSKGSLFWLPSVNGGPTRSMRLMCSPSTVDSGTVQPALRQAPNGSRPKDWGDFVQLLLDGPRGQGGGER